MYEVDELLPLAAIQHLAFCERQCALMYVEGLWVENRLTVLGALLHEQAHQQAAEWRDGALLVHALPVRSLRLGLSGIADLVEFHPVTDGGIPLPSRRGLFRPFPVEYKRGSPKPEACDEAQLCAQAMCLEEMLGVSVPAGAIFYGEPRRRLPVEFTAELRAWTESLAVRLHELVRSRQTPPATRRPECRSCSLRDLCLPPPARRRRSASQYLQRMLAAAISDGPPACDMER